MGFLRRLLPIIVAVLLLYSMAPMLRSEADLPPLANGDLIFQTSWTNQSMAVGLATWSLYLHTGIIKLTAEGPMVVHAGAQVEETPLKQWISGGIMRRFAVYRYKDLTPEQGKAIIAHTRPHYGKAYDIYFLFNNDKIYCSELPYLAYRQAGITLGTMEKVGDLSINNGFARKLIEQRWQTHPECQSSGMTFDQCYERIMQQMLISPESLSKDNNLERLFSNYPSL